MLCFLVRPLRLGLLIEESQSLSSMTEALSLQSLPRDSRDVVVADDDRSLQVLRFNPLSWSCHVACCDALVLQEDLAVEFPSRSGLPSVSLPYLLGSSSNADNFCDFFLPEMPCLHFHCADPAAFSPHFDGSFELCMADRILEPNF